MVGNDIGQKDLLAGGGNLGNKKDKGVLVGNSQKEGNLNSSEKILVDLNETNGLVILDPKRRRVAKYTLISPNVKKIVFDIYMIDNQEHASCSKNSFEAGAAQQACQSL